MGTPQSCLIFSRVKWHRWLLSVLKMFFNMFSKILNSQCSAPRVCQNQNLQRSCSVRTVQQVLLDPWNLENQPGLEQSLQRIAATLHWFFGILWYSLALVKIDSLGNQILEAYAKHIWTHFNPPSTMSIFPAFA